MKKFKTKKSSFLIKILLYLGIFFISSFTMVNYLAKLNSNWNVDPEKYVKLLLAEGFNNQIKDYQENNFFDINKPLNLIQNALNFKWQDNITNQSNTIESINDNNNLNNDPLVYLYNTHDTEKYQNTSLQPYNITPDVKLASYIMQEKLDDLGIKSIVETTSIQSILNRENWPYSYSYKASRELIINAKQNNPTLKLFIDIHRDSAVADKTTLDYQNNKYARVLFVVGLENPNSNFNLNLANYLNDATNNEVPNLSRGISKKEGPGVNGVYNQDLDPNAILIEIGGEANNIVEVSKTINILANKLYNYIGDDLNEKAKL
jgi:stage II sporulation protein P